MTAGDIIASAMRLFGACAAGDTPSTSEGTDGLIRLNDILDSWSTERLNIFRYLTTSYALTTATPAYTLGSGGTFTGSTRPTRIITVGVLIPNSGASGTLHIPVKLVGQAEFAIETEKGAKGTIPRIAYYDNAFPLGTLTFAPTPTFTGAESAELYTLEVLSSFPDQTSTVNFPPGYARALRYNLAVDYAPEFGRECSPSVIATANESKAALRALNLAVLNPGTEPASSPVDAIPSQAA